MRSTKHRTVLATLLLALNVQAAVPPAPAIGPSLDPARLHQEKALAALGDALEEGDSRDFQRALLHALHVQREGAALDPDALGRLATRLGEEAFALRWRSPAQWLGGPVTGVAWTPDGGSLLTAGGDGAVRLWDLARGTERARLPLAAEGLETLLLSPDGKLAAAGAADGTLWLWELGEPPRLRARIPAHHGKLRALAFSPDGRLLASGGYDGDLALWNPADGQALGRLAGGSGQVYAVAFSPNGALLAAGTEKGGAALWRLNPAAGANPAPRLLGRVAREGKKVWSLAFAPSAADTIQRLITGSNDGNTRLWEFAGGLEEIAPNLPAPRIVAEAQGERLIAMAVSPDGARLAMGTDKGRVRLWDLSHGDEPGAGPALRADLGPHGGRTLALAFTADGRRLAGATLAGGLRVWNLEGETPVLTLPAALTGHANGVQAVAASPDGRLIASGDGDGVIWLWDPASGRALGRLEHDASTVSALRFDPEGQRLAVGGSNGKVRLWDLGAGAERAVAGVTLEAKGRRLTALAFGGDGATLAGALDDGGAVVWDLRSGTVRSKLPRTAERSWSAALDDRARVLASGTEKGLIRLMDLTSGQLRRDVKGVGGRVGALAVSRDGALLAAGMEDGYVRLLELESGRERRRLVGGGGYAVSLAFTDDGSRVVAGWNDGSIRLWDVASGDSLGRLSDLGGRANGLASTANGTRLVSSSADGAARLAARIEGGGSKILSLAFDPSGHRLAYGSVDGGVHRLDLRTFLLLANGPSPAPRAGLIEETLQRLWRLRFDGGDFVPEAWPRLEPREGAYTDQALELDVRPAAAADPTSPPARRRFDLRPLLDPPAAGQDRLDQVLQWLAEQEARLGP